MAVDQRVEFPLADDHFSGQQNITGSVAGLEDLFNQVNEETVTQTYEESHYYADSVNGDDDNDGLTAATAKQTLTGLFASAPVFYRHDTAFHLTGDFDEGGFPEFVPFITDGAKVIVDGGDEVVIISGPHTIDAGASVSSFTSTGLGATPDEYAGYILRINDDPSQDRLIFEHTADTFYPCEDLPADPSGLTFTIIRPATTMSNNTNPSFYPMGKGSFRIQRLYMATGNGRVSVSAGTAITSLSHIISDCTSTFAAFQLSRIASISVRDWIYIVDPTNPSVFSSDTSPSVGISQRNSASKLLIENVNNINGFISSYFRGINMSGSTSGATGVFLQGVRVHGSVEVVGFVDIALDGNFWRILKTTFRPTRIDGASGVGLKLISSTVTVNSGSKSSIIVQDCGTHAIELVDSLLIDNKGGMSGTGNTGAGVYAHLGSKILIKDGAPPTITGTVGELSVDGTTQASTWAAIDAGTQVSDTTEFVIAKEQ